jgi:hypothetical protein
MSRNISVNLCTSVSSVVKKNSCQGTADYTDETDTADEEKPHQRRTEGSQTEGSQTEGSQSVYICVHLCHLW